MPTGKVIHTIVEYFIFGKKFHLVLIRENTLRAIAYRLDLLLVCHELMQINNTNKEFGCPAKRLYFGATVQIVIFKVREGRVAPLLG